jgi:hypothetical protein
MVTTGPSDKRTSYERIIGVKRLNKCVWHQLFPSLMKDTDENRVILAAIRFWADLIIVYPIWIILTIILGTFSSLYGYFQSVYIAPECGSVVRDSPGAATPTPTACNYCGCSDATPTSKSHNHCNMCLQLPDLVAVVDGMEIVDLIKWAAVVINLPPMICVSYHGFPMTAIWCWTLCSIFFTALMSMMVLPRLSAQIEELRAAKEGKDVKGDEEVNEVIKTAQEVEWDVLDHDGL